MEYKKYMKYLVDIPEEIKNKSVENESTVVVPKINSIITDIEENVSKEFNLSERVVYDRNAKKPELSERMVEMVKRQITGMNGYTLSRVYETKGTYRMVFESDGDGCFEITIREKS